MGEDHCAGPVARRLREEAERLGMSSEEYLVKLVTQGLDPRGRSVEYVKSAEELLEEAKGELSEGNVRQAAEKVWGAAALAVKAYAWWRDGRRLTSHGELWAYKDVLAGELGEWVREAWMYANSMHVCFYESWCAEKDVEAAIRNAERLVREVRVRVSGDA